MQWNDKLRISFLERTHLFGRRLDHFSFYFLKHEGIEILVYPQDVKLDWEYYDYAHLKTR